MENTQATMTAPALTTQRPATALDGTQAVQVIEELDGIVSKSRRRSPLRRVLRRVGSAFVKSLERLVPPTPPAGSAEQPPEIRFPFF